MWAMTLKSHIQNAKEAMDPEIKLVDAVKANVRSRTGVSRLTKVNAPIEAEIERD